MWIVGCRCCVPADGVEPPPSSNFTGVNCWDAIKPSTDVDPNLDVVFEACAFTKSKCSTARTVAYTTQQQLVAAFNKILSYETPSGGKWTGFQKTSSLQYFMSLSSQEDLVEYGEQTFAIYEPTGGNIEQRQSIDEGEYLKQQEALRAQARLDNYAHAVQTSLASSSPLAIEAKRIAIESKSLAISSPIESKALDQVLKHSQTSVSHGDSTAFSDLMPALDKPSHGKNFHADDDGG